MDSLIVKKPLQKRSYARIIILCIVGVSNLKHVCMWEHFFSTVLVCLLIVTFGNYGCLVFTAYSAELTVEEKVLAFLEDVVMLDMKKYNVTMVIAPENYSTYWGTLYLEDVSFTLESNESVLNALFVFENYTLTWFSLYVREGSPFYVQLPSTNFLERADVFLQRYQIYTASDCQEMRDILATVTEVKNMTITVDNVRFELTKESSSTQFRWYNTFNGTDYTRLSITLLQRGEFAFSDTRHLYKIGSVDVDISREEAISIARERAKNLTWKVKVGNETIEVTNYTIVDEPVEAALYTRCREPLVLYPYWGVTLYLDKVYPGNVYGFTFEIWADTGEIINGRLRFFMGGIPPEDSTEPNMSPEFPDIDLTPPTISILSPENKTYTTNSVSLSIEVDEATSWIGYSLDGQANLTLSENTGLYISALSEHLTGLPDGTHSIVVYAEDTAGNTGTSETIYFSIAQETESQEPPPDDSTGQTNLTPLLIAVPIVLAITLGVAFYRRKRNVSLEPLT